MAEDTRDILMQVVLKGKPIQAEAKSIIADRDALASGFTSATATSSANFFALQEYQMELGLLDDTAPAEDPKIAKTIKRHSDANQKQIMQLQQALKLLGKSPGLKLSDGSNKFLRFISRGRNSVKTQSYSSNLEAVTFSKPMDVSSLVLFTAAKDKTVLDSATVIKRRGGGGKQLRTFLRIDFTNLLITDFSWSEDDVVKETIKFICRKAQVKYSIEKDDGTMKPPGAPGIWVPKGT
jgi:type VI protein secretion system component Hcp